SVIVNGKKMDGYVNENSISAAYFKTMGTPLLAGRDFNDGDTPQAPQVTIVNEAFARKILGGQDPVGKTFQFDVYNGEQPREYQIVGVVKNTKYYDLREDFDPLVYFPQTQDRKP